MASKEEKEIIPTFTIVYDENGLPTVTPPVIEAKVTKPDGTQRPVTLTATVGGGYKEGVGGAG